PYIVDGDAPYIASIGDRTVDVVRGAESVSWTVTYGGDPVDITLDETDIVPVASPADSCAALNITVTGSGTVERTVTLSNFTGRGQLGFSIVPPSGTATATDSAGNGDTIGFTMSPASYVLVDNRQETTLTLNVAPL